MRNLAFIWALIWSVVAVGEVNATPHSGVDQTPTSQAGELSVSLPNLVTGKIQYQYGEIPEINDGAPEDLNRVVENIRHLQTGINSPQEIIQFDVEGEQSSLPPAITRSIHVEHISVPKNLISRFRLAVKESYVKPGKKNWRFGLVLGGVSATVSGIVWASMNVPPEMVTLMVIANGSWTAVSTANYQFFAKIFTRGLGIEPGKDLTAKQFANSWLRQTAFSLVISNLFNVLGGLRNTPIRASENTIINSVASNTFGVKKNQILENKIHLNQALSLVTSPIFFILQAMEGTGHLPVLGHIGSYEIKSSMLASFAIYGALTLASYAKPEFMIRFMEMIHQRFVIQIMGTGLSNCGEVFNQSPFTASPSVSY